MAPPLGLIFSGVSLVAAILVVIGTATPAWIFSDSKTPDTPGVPNSQLIGLSETCADDVCVANWGDEGLYPEATCTAWEEANNALKDADMETQAPSCGGMQAGNGLAITASVFTMIGSVVAPAIVVLKEGEFVKSTPIRGVVAGLISLGGLFAIIAFAVFVSAMPEAENPYTDSGLGFSAIIHLVGGVLCFICGIGFFLKGSGGVIVVGPE